ncbi:MAG: DUF1749 domain-containing protein [Clostridia bacterium]|nr:DUF1749 domain-containing protein [Clostridia bacterium]
MIKLNVPTKRGTVLNGVLFDAKNAHTVVIVITGIHGNFYSNPFYYNFGDTLNADGIDFIYAQTNDALGKIDTVNVNTGKPEIIGSFKEDFNDTDEDIEAYLDYAAQAGYRHIILAGHSLGANKVIYYLSRHHDARVEHFLLLSPANLKHMTSDTSEQEKQIVKQMVASGHGQEFLPFYFMGWLPCYADTAYQWLFTDTLNNVHVETDGDFSQCEKITHTGALLIGTYDRFTYGDPAGFLKNINNHIPTAAQNKLIFIEKTGHTYQQKEQEVADAILKLVLDWRK